MTALSGPVDTRLKPLVKLAKTITAQRAGIEAAIYHGPCPSREQQHQEVPFAARSWTGLFSGTCIGCCCSHLS